MSWYFPQAVLVLQAAISYSGTRSVPSRWTSVIGARTAARSSAERASRRGSGASNWGRAKRCRQPVGRRVQSRFSPHTDLGTIRGIRIRRSLHRDRGGRGFVRAI